MQQGEGKKKYEEWLLTSPLYVDRTFEYSELYEVGTSMAVGTTFRFDAYCVGCKDTSHFTHTTSDSCYVAG